MTTQRSYDSIFILRQNNEARTLTIMESNENAGTLLSHAHESLQGLPLSQFLGAKTAEYIEESLEFESDGDDFYAICQKIRDIRLKRSDGSEFSAEFHIAPLESRDGHQWFRLVIVNEQEQRKREQFSQFLQDHLAGLAALDPDTQLPSGGAAASYVEMFKRMLDSNEMQGICALLRVDRQHKTLARYGRDGLISLLKHVANCCKSTFRADDVVCQIDSHTLALFLVDIDMDAARVVLNRLRWNIRNHRIHFGGKEDFSVTVSIAFASVAENAAAALEKPLASLAALPEDERNQLIELVA